MAPRTHSILKRKGSPRSYYGDVSFGDVTVYVFQSILGDNPACSDGCPIALGSELKLQSTITVKQHEQVKKTRPRHTKRVNRLNAAARDTYLLNEGYTLAEIDATADAIKLIQKQRINTNESTKTTSWGIFRRAVDGTFKAQRKLAGIAA